MGRQSSIDRLPPDILEQFQALLRDPRVTQLDATARINAVLQDDGRAERVSKSAANRYAVKMETVGKKLRESREVAEMWIAKVGAAPQGQMGHLINEMLRTLAFDLTLKLQDGVIETDDMPGIIDMLKQLSLSVMRLENAANLNVKREKEIKRQALEAAAKAAGEVAKQGGVSADTIATIRERIIMGAGR